MEKLLSSKQSEIGKLLPKLLDRILEHVGAHVATGGRAIRTGGSAPALSLQTFRRTYAKLRIPRVVACSPWHI